MEVRISSQYEWYTAPLRFDEFLGRGKRFGEELFDLFDNVLAELLFLLKIEFGAHCFLAADKKSVYSIYRSHSQGKGRPAPEYNAVNLEGISVEFLSEIETPLEVVQVKSLSVEQVAPFLKALKMDVQGKDSYDYSLVSLGYKGLDLGFLILWGNYSSEAKELVHSRFVRDQLSNWNRRLGIVLKGFEVNSHTFLPLHRSIGWKRAAIMFLDIRNFTTLTEILRNRMNIKKEENEKMEEGKNGILNTIVNEFCQEMCNIVHKRSSGRVDKFMGDGILVIFGETEINPSKIVTQALDVAVEMIKKFQELKEKWQVMAFGEGYDSEFNETVDIDLGIGIDFGTVLFDQFGDERHREYGVVGDHVNFSSRLQGMGARMDEKTGKKRPPVILSRTAYRCCKPWIKDDGKQVDEMFLDLKGKSYKYLCFGLYPEGFDSTRYDMSLSSDDWETAWNNVKEGPPRIES